MFSWNVHTETIVEGFRDIIVDPEIVAALVGALGDEDSYARRGAVNFFTATIAQGVLSCCHGMLILKSSRRGLSRRDI